MGTGIVGGFGIDIVETDEQVSPGAFGTCTFGTVAVYL